MVKDAMSRLWMILVTMARVRVCGAAGAYELRFGEKRLKDTDRLRIGRDVNNGALLTACAHNDHVTYYYYTCTLSHVRRATASSLIEQALCQHVCGCPSTCRG